MNRQPARWDGAHGFTLIELMLAVMILGLILAMLAGSFHATAVSKLHGEARLSVDRAGRAVLWEMSNEIAGAVQTQPFQSNVVLKGVAHTAPHGAADSITLSTLDAGHRRTIFGFGPEDIVAYHLVRNQEQSGWYMLERSEWSGLLDAQKSPTPPVILADNVLSLHIEYFNGQKWLQSWDSSSLPAPTQLPVAVMIDLAMAAPYGHTMEFSTEVTVPMAMEPGAPVIYSLW